MANLGQSWDVHKIKRAALPEYHTYSIWRLGKKNAQPLDAVEALRSAFCALRREGSRRKTGNVTARRGALERTSPEALHYSARVSHSRVGRVQLIRLHNRGA